MPAQIMSRSPQRPSDVVYSGTETSPEEVGAAFERARRAQQRWWAAPASERANALAKAADALASSSGELVELGIREVGKPRREMVGEVARGVSILRYYAGACLDAEGDSLPSPDGHSMLLARRRPHGVAGLVTPWNFPVAIPLWKLAPALAWGNAAVLKPAPSATAVALRLCEVISAELPEDLLSVVVGDAGAGGALVDAADAVSFTGSSSVGSAVSARAVGRGVPVQAEMGGQNPSIVLADADIDHAAGVIAAAAMGYAGQKCTATSRVVVEAGRAGELTEALAAALDRLALGDPSDEATVVGPVIDEEARKAVLEAAAQAVGSGGRVVRGGSAGEREGYFVAPTLVEGVEYRHRVAQEEIFGPFAVVIPAAGTEEALAVANGVRQGLVASVFTRDLDRALYFVDRLEVGLVRVNAPTSGVDFYAPFGGVKDSSYGPREQGKAARDFYTWTQTVTISPERA